MRLLPFGSTLPVHCCCEPGGKRLGWVPVSENARTNQFVSFMENPTLRVLFGGEPGQGIIPARSIHTTIEILDLVVRPAELYVCALGKPHYTISVHKRILAVNSNDVPIERWRKVAGFVEDRYGKEEDTGERTRRRDAAEEEARHFYSGETLRRE